MTSPKQGTNDRRPEAAADRPEALLRRLGVAFPDCGAVSHAPAATWDYGTVVGNGTQGALAYCRTAAETLVLSHEELFLPLFPFYGYVPLREHHETVRQLVLEGRTEAAQALIRKLKADAGLPLWNTTNPFVGAACLRLTMDGRGPAADAMRSIDFATGEALVAWTDDSGLYHRGFFASRTEDVIVVRLTSPGGAKLNLTIALQEIPYDPPAHLEREDMYGKTIDHCVGTVADTHLTHRMVFKERCADHPVHGCCTIARVVCAGGTATVAGDSLRVEQADAVLLLVRTVPDRRGARLSVAESVASLMQVDPDYDRLLADHAAVHGERFGRCALQLSDPGDPPQTVEAMQAGSAIGRTTPALVEKAFAAGRYGIISSTGTRPPLLQGVWTGTWKPRWSGDYTLNGNVQSMVADSLCGNHYECQETLMDYLDTLMDDFRENARELLGFRGPLIPWRSSTHGRTHYLSCYGRYHDFPAIYWFAGAGWFAQLYYDYYLYTGDESFFETRLKPFLLDAAALYEDCLTEGPEGLLVLCPSSSPENELADNVWMAPNATITIAVVKQLLRTVLRLHTKLGVEASRVATWRTMLATLPPYAVDAAGALQEWTWPGIDNNEAHRHASHLYPLYYGVDPEIAASDVLREACRVAIDRRMAFRRDEQGGDMAFGFTQLGMAAAHLGDTALAYECVEYLVNSYWSPAMMSLHNVGEVFNLDISGGLPAVIITMLVQCDLPDPADGPWRIRLLPCLPDAWPRGRLRGVRCRGGFELDIAWRDGMLETVTITSLRGEPATLSYRDRTATMPTAGERCVFSGCLEPA